MTGDALFFFCGLYCPPSLGIDRRLSSNLWHFQTLSLPSGGGEVQRCLPSCGWGVTFAAKQSLPSPIQRESPEGWRRTDGDVTRRPEDGTQILALQGSQPPCPQVKTSFIYRGIRPRPYMSTLTEHQESVAVGGIQRLKGRS